MGLEYFQKFLDKPMQRESINIFLKILYLPKMVAESGPK